MSMPHCPATLTPCFSVVSPGCQAGRICVMIACLARGRHRAQVQINEINTRFTIDKSKDGNSQKIVTVYM